MAKAAKKTAAPPEDIVEYFDKVEQRSEEWYRLRLGIPTASVFATVMASGVDGGESIGRKKLLYQLAGERLTGRPAERFSNPDMQRGVDMEPAARAFYKRTRFADIEEIGFIRRTIHNPFGEPLIVGCSPDSLIGKNKLLQIKTMKPELLIPLAENGARGFPAEHRAQCQGELWVSGREETDLMIFYEGMPVAPTYTIARDEIFIKKIRDACEVFTYDLRKLVERLRDMAPR